MPFPWSIYKKRDSIFYICFKLNQFTYWIQRDFFFLHLQAKFNKFRVTFNVVFFFVFKLIHNTFVRLDLLNFVHFATISLCPCIGIYKCKKKRMMKKEENNNSNNSNNKQKERRLVKTVKMKRCIKRKSFIGFLLYKA